MHTRFPLPPLWVLGAALLLAGCAGRPLATPDALSPSAPLTMAPALEAATLPAPRVIGRVASSRPPPIVRASARAPTPERLVATAPAVRALRPAARPRPAAARARPRVRSVVPPFDPRACSRAAPSTARGGREAVWMTRAPVEFGACSGGT